MLWTFQTFVIENKVTPEKDLIAIIIEHLERLNEIFFFILKMNLKSSINTHGI